jgi:ectoine hydroxylase-related dioxygenase (phytanoyl-CoA dioxygenase family)
MNFLSGNTALKSTESQPVHTDADFAHPQIPFAVVVNVPLVTMTPENGATEFWLGTHTNSGLHIQEDWRGDKAGGEIKNDIVEARRKEFPPIQPVISKGSIIIRDLRLWHCGKPNFEGTPRILLAMIHFASWYRNSMRFSTFQILTLC